MATTSRVMTRPRASVSGAILGAYVMLGGVQIEHLLTAMGMTAPISLVFAKLHLSQSLAKCNAQSCPNCRRARRDSQR